MPTDKLDIQPDAPMVKPSEKWRSKLQERKPELDWDNDPEAPYTALDEYDNEVSGKLNKYQESDGRMRDMFMKNPEMAGVFADVAEGENPALALVKHFGEEALSAKDNPDLAEGFVKAQQDYIEKLSTSKKIEEEQTANLETSIETLKAFAAEKGMSEEEVSEFSDKLFQDADDIFMGRFTKELLENKYLGMHYNEDVTDAAEMGKTEGMNQKIRTTSKKLVGDGLPNIPSTPIETPAKGAIPPKRDMFNMRG